MKSYIYRFVNKDQKVIYVGKTNNLNKRYNQHFGKRGHLTKDCYNSVWKIEYIKVDSELNALLLETYYINKFRPKYNKLNKTYRSTNTENVNLKEIQNNWKLYKIVNESFAPNMKKGRRLTFKENLFFYSLMIFSILYVTFLYLK